VKNGVGLGMRVECRPKSVKFWKIHNELIMHISSKRCLSPINYQHLHTV